MEAAQDVLSALTDIADPEQVAYVSRFFTGDDPQTKILGVPMPKVFPIAKAYRALDLTEVERLLDSPFYEARMAAVAIMDFKAQRKSLPADDRQALFDLYLRRHDRINNWDLVDRAAARVVGAHLHLNGQGIPETLIVSDDPNQRRTAVVATFAFLRAGDVSETFRVATRLAGDPNTYVQKAVASWVREAGKRDEDTLIAFLRQHQSVLPRSTRTAASKHLPKELAQELRG